MRSIRQTWDTNESFDIEIEYTYDPGQGLQPQSVDIHHAWITNNGTRIDVLDAMSEVALDDIQTEIMERQSE